MKNNELTPREKETLGFIIEFKKSHDGNSPSMREIARGLGYNNIETSNSVIWHYVHNLEQKGFIRLPDTLISRSIEVVGGKYTYDEGNVVLAVKE